MKHLGQFLRSININIPIKLKKVRKRAIVALSVEELKKRLESRGTETLESLTARVNKASYEISFKSHFDEVIVNDNLNKACAEALKLVGDFLSEPLQQGQKSD